MFNVSICGFDIIFIPLDVRRAEINAPIDGNFAPWNDIILPITPIPRPVPSPEILDAPWVREPIILPKFPVFALLPTIAPEPFPAPINHSTPNWELLSILVSKIKASTYTWRRGTSSLDINESKLSYNSLSPIAKIEFVALSEEILTFELDEAVAAVPVLPACWEREDTSFDKTFSTSSALAFFK